MAKDTNATINFNQNSKLESLDFKDFLNIEKFKNSSTVYDNLGIPLSNRFACLLNAGKFTELEKNGWLEFQVMSVECPGITIETQSMELNGMNRHYFKNRSNDDLQITFLETSELTLRDFFNTWMEKTLKIGRNGGVTRGYLADVVASDFAIIPLDFMGTGRRADRFLHVFPVKIQDLNYNYATAGEIIKTTVTFKYMHHTVEPINIKQDNSHTAAKRQNTKK